MALMRLNVSTCTPSGFRYATVSVGVEAQCRMYAIRFVSHGADRAVEYGEPDGVHAMLRLHVIRRRSVVPYGRNLVRTTDGPADVEA